MSQSMSGKEQAREFIMGVLLRNLRNLRLAVEAYHLKVEQKCSTDELREVAEMVNYWVQRVENNRLSLEAIEES
jgi:hypothetical protein